ncbi:MAG: hypothetical protein AAGA23_10520 [Pseudomonadota bacterium]
MTDDSVSLTCQCGSVRYRVPQAPLFRAYCHCGICRRFNEAARADILVYRLAEVSLPEEGTVEFSTYRPPPNVRRGRCARCRQAALEVFRSPLLPQLAIVPRGMLPVDAALPESSCHLFFEGSVTDVDDDLPRYRGYLRSQLAFFKMLFFSKR